LVKEPANCRPPLIGAPTHACWWNDLIRIEPGFGAEPGYMRHAIHGRTNVEAGRQPIGEIAPEGRHLLPGERGEKMGGPLFPR